MPNTLKFFKSNYLYKKIFIFLIFPCCLACAQSGKFNDTGQTFCFDALGNSTACVMGIAGNAGVRPHQDGRYGRDVATLNKIGSGAAGFDFSCVLWNGVIVNSAACTGTLIVNNSGLPTASPNSDWACTKDNITGLVWSLQTQTTNWDTATTTTYANPGHNTSNRCGYSSGWRLPTRRELLNIIHHGSTTTPLIDINFFPGTQSGAYLSNDTFARNLTQAWDINFATGNNGADIKSNPKFVRLVRSAN